METQRDGYLPTIGLEVHVELKTKTKMFCGSRNDPHAAEPNIHTCPICMGHPGTLPVVNAEAVRHVLRVGIAVSGELADYTEFDRKNYFYPDIPKGYQISQYAYPLVRGGVLEGVTITRVHLEEDTARSQHEHKEGSLIDYNRAGVPLMELVTEPVIHDAKKAAHFAKELQLLLRTLGVSEANMEKGEMRVEANISVSKTDTFGTKVEVKNLNSFKSVEGAISYEIERQIKTITEGGKIIQETRGWDENKGTTFSQRLKESSDDYRYFPEPDIPKLQMKVSEIVSVSRLSETLPELPNKKRIKYNDLGLSREQIDLIISNIEIDKFFCSFLETLNDTPNSEVIRLGANYLTSDLLSLLADNRNLNAASPTHFKDLILLVVEGQINSRIAKDLLCEVVFEFKNPSDLAKNKGLLQENDLESLQIVVTKIIQANTAVVEEYRAGKTSSIQYLVGQGMKESRGTANPTTLRRLLEEELGRK